MKASSTEGQKNKETTCPYIGPQNVDEETLYYSSPKENRQDNLQDKNHNLYVRYEQTIEDGKQYNFNDDINESGNGKEALLPSNYNPRTQEIEEDTLNSPTTKYSSIVQKRRKRKSYCSTSLCFLLLLISLLLFFIYPRDPSVQLDSIYIKDYTYKNTSSSSQIQLVGEFEFINFNYYDMKFQNLQFDVVNSNNHEIIYGTGKYDDVIQTKMRTVNSIIVYIETTSSQAKTIRKCVQKEIQSIDLTLGEATIEAETTGIVKKKIGQMKVNSGTLTLCCTSNC